MLQPDICDDPKQLLYRNCTYIYPSGSQCTSPVATYLTPPLCGGHCDVAILATPISGGEPRKLGNTSAKATHHSSEKDGVCEYTESVERATKSTLEFEEISALKRSRERGSIVQEAGERRNSNTASSVEADSVLSCVEVMEVDGTSASGEKASWAAACEGEQTATSQDTVDTS